VRVAVAWAGICGSDRDLLAGTRPPGFVRYPVIPGHEWSGIVDAVGEGVDGSLVGQPVVGEGFRSCTTCPACRRGDTTLCEAAYEETGFTQPGTWSDHVIVPARLLHVLAPDADLRAAAGLEPAACVAEAFLLAEPRAGERIAVVGGGNLGLLATQLLASAQPVALTVFDTRHDIAERAHACGATDVRHSNDVTGLEFDVVVEAAGGAGSAALAVQLARRGGRVVLTGIPMGATDSILTRQLVTKQLSVHTVFGAPRRAWEHAVLAFSAGTLDPGVLVTHELPLEEISSAFRLLDEQPEGLGKILLRP
jgi:threonine dehydrogenase-like Zn-dependent dehydrogenase